MGINMGVYSPNEVRELEDYRIYLRPHIYTVFVAYVRRFAEGFGEKQVVARTLHRLHLRRGEPARGRGGGRDRLHLCLRRRRPMHLWVKP